MISGADASGSLPVGSGSDAAASVGTTATACRRLGLVVNPVAGIGGAVGLKGSDGVETVRRALALGAVPRARTRAAATLARLAECWPADQRPPVLLTAPGPMGEDSARDAGFEPVVVGRLPESETSADDTRRLVAEVAAAGVDLLLFAGGDGTARDVVASLPAATPALGIPAGVKIQSAVYATSPVTAGELVASFLRAHTGRRRTAPREVLDLDEDAYRRGRVAPCLYGELLTPVENRRLQTRKEPSPASEAGAAAEIANEVARALVPGYRYVLGPGSTIRMLATRLGVPKTLVGVDVVEIDDDGTVRVVASDVGARDLSSLVAETPAVLVVTPIGGQGFILGRGNQQIDPGVVRTVLERLGRAALVVAATPAKLASLRGRPLLVDSGDVELDAALAGHVLVVTGQRERTVYPVIAA